MNPAYEWTTTALKPPAGNGTTGKRPTATPMTRIAINPEAFEAIAATMPLGSVGYEAEVNERGERVI